VTQRKKSTILVGDRGPIEPTTGQEDKTLAEVIQGLSAIDDFGYIANGGDDAANFDAGRSGYFLGGYDPAIKRVIVPDGVPAIGTLGPSEAPTKGQAETTLDGCELFIFEDAELSGMIITLSNDLGLSITFSLADLQVDPPTPNAADDTLIAIDLDTLAGFDGTYIDTIRIQDDGIYCPRTNTGDTTLEIDAIATRPTQSTVECTVNFYTEPSNIGNITFMGVTYINGETDVFVYGTSGLATANAPVGWTFDHWEFTANLTLSPNEYANPVTVTVECGGNLTAVFKRGECTVNFYTDPSTVGNITVSGADTTYFNGDTKVYNYSDTFSATANAPVGWVFDHWIAEGNIQLSSTTDNPTTVTIVCGGNLTAVFTEEHGNGDFGTIGYWKHVFYVWKTSKGSFKDFTGELLEGYLANINTTSMVFSENYTLTLESAYDLLWSHDSSMRTRALKQCLASWLNWANGAVTMSQIVDTDYNGIPDMTFGNAMAIVENILRDPSSSWGDLEYAKNICDSINNM